MTHVLALVSTCRLSNIWPVRTPFFFFFFIIIWKLLSDPEHLGKGSLDLKCLLFSPVELNSVAHICLCWSFNPDRCV